MKTSMNNRHLKSGKTLIALLLAAAIGGTGTGAFAAGEPTATMDQANRAYYEGRFDHSLQLYQQLAAAGNAAAAERAGFMLFHGNAYYGPQVRSDIPRATALLVQAAKAGRSGAEFMLNQIDRIN